MNWYEAYGITKPFYADDAVCIVNADCRDILPLLPDKSVDLVLTDPPYGVGLAYDEYQDTPDNLIQMIKWFVPEVRRIGKAVLITCRVINQWFYPQPDWVLGWFIPTTNSGSSVWGFSCWQPILAYGKDPYLTNNLGRQMDTISIMATRLTRNGHPCPKPLQVWERLINRGTVKYGNLILDPFLGSGTTAVASKILGRKCIGIEISEKYCEIAAKRCSQSVMQLETPIEKKLETVKLI